MHDSLIEGNLSKSRWILLRLYDRLISLRDIEIRDEVISLYNGLIGESRWICVASESAGLIKYSLLRGSVRELETVVSCRPILNL